MLAGKEASMDGETLFDRSSGTGRGGADRTSFPWCLPSFDHLVGEREQPVWNLEAERLGGLEVDHQLELGRAASLLAKSHALPSPMIALGDFMKAFIGQ